MIYDIRLDELAADRWTAQKQNVFTLLLVEDQVSQSAARWFHDEAFHGSADLVVARSFAEAAYLIIRQSKKLDGYVFDVDLTVLRSGQSPGDPYWPELLDKLRLECSDTWRTLLNQKSHLNGGLWLWAMSLARDRMKPTLFYSGHGERYEDLLRPLMDAGYVQYFPKVFRNAANDGVPQAPSDSVRHSVDVIWNRIGDIAARTDDAEIKELAKSAVRLVCILADLPLEPAEVQALGDYLRKKIVPPEFIPRIDRIFGDGSAKTRQNSPQVSGQIENEVLRRFMRACRDLRSAEIPFAAIKEAIYCARDGESIARTLCPDGFTVQQYHPEYPPESLTPQEAPNWFHAPSQYDRLEQVFRDRRINDLVHAMVPISEITEEHWYRLKRFLAEREITPETSEWLMPMIDNHDRAGLIQAYGALKLGTERGCAHARARLKNFPIAPDRLADPGIVQEILALIGRKAGESADSLQVAPYWEQTPGNANNGRLIWLAPQPWLADEFAPRIRAALCSSRQTTFRRISRLSSGYAAVYACRWSAGAIEWASLDNPSCVGQNSDPVRFLRTHREHLMQGSWWIDADFRLVGGGFAPRD